MNKEVEYKQEGIQQYSFHENLSLLPSLHSSNLLSQGQNIRHRPNRRNTKRINLLVATGIMSLDMLELRRLAERGHVPVQLAHPGVQTRIARADITDITLEVLHVDGVEADNGREQPDVGLGDGRAEVIWPRGVGGEMGLGAVEGAEESEHVLLVGGLARCEAGLVDAVVDLVVGPGVCVFDGGFEVGGEQIDGAVGLVEEVVEFGVEHAQDVCGFVADDLVLFFVVQGRHGEAAGVVGVDLEVDLAQVGVFWVQRVFGYVFAGAVLVVFDKAPAWRRN